MPCTDTPQGRPPKERNGPRTNRIAHRAGNVKPPAAENLTPAGSRPRAWATKPKQRAEGLALTRAVKWEARRRAKNPG